MVTLPAEFDLLTAPPCYDQLCLALATPGVTVVVADLTGTSLCDVAGARLLLRAHEAAAAHGAQLRLVVTPGPVLDVLTLLGLDHRLSMDRP